MEGYAARFNKPYTLFESDGIKYFEDIDRRALDNADVSDVIMQFDHEGRVLARQSNSTLVIKPDDNGILIGADLSKTDASRALYEDIASGMVTKMSWAFTVAEQEFNRETRTRTITKVQKVYDVSAVSIPANDDTTILARSFIDGEIEKEQQELLVRQKAIALYEFEKERGKN